jgi:hypothetical protein
MGVSGSGTSRTFTFSGNLSAATSYQILVSGVDFELYDIGGGYTEIFNYYSSVINVYKEPKKFTTDEIERKNRIAKKWRNPE